MKVKVGIKRAAAQPKDIELGVALEIQYPNADIDRIVVSLDQNIRVCVERTVREHYNQMAIRRDNEIIALERDGFEVDFE